MISVIVVVIIVITYDTIKIYFTEIYVKLYEEKQRQSSCFD